MRNRSHWARRPLPWLAFALRCAILGLLPPSTGGRAAETFWPGDEVAAEDLEGAAFPLTQNRSPFDRWHEMTVASRNRQPQWVTPLITITPDLVQQVRYDVYDQTKSSGNKSWDFGNGKGIDLLVAPTVQITVGLPQYLYSPAGGGVSGLRGENFAIKERILSSPENEDNFVLSVYLGALSPTGTLTAREPSDHWVWTPMLLFGKGWGPFDMMINVGTQYADGDNRNLESAFLYNLALQYRVGLLCPSVEISSGPTITRFLDVGTSGLFITPQLLLGPFSAGKDVSFAGGIGYQIALNQVSVLEQYANAWILSFRMIF
ncbi:hypothetical protein MAMC_01363 [Methylacidimicrobium cyclopophantes]|uniref:Uncharacterized protein n=1 Tax=Methylacidimicrobium cyclopophantes TaxID=1041766 RepID=A0A5E6MFD2_9BACT|nr:hypothetical protein [Methylacidimicrobium cyclopophantes]VVM06951.1 hypothetical protein MAMC_01363 [Methylacidimicrobium cyclopophantes]